LESLETKKRGAGLPLWAAALAALLLWDAPARAVPSFARQTGMDCSACHTVFPELNKFGRLFKMTGYNVGSVKWITGTDAQGNTRVQVASIPPIAAMVQVSNQWTAKNPITTTAAGSDGGGTNSFPAQFSFFYSGAITPNMGSFVQITYDPGDGHFVFDNTDIRYADRTDVLGTDLIYGITANNNPTVQDVWNSAPAWGFPYAVPAGSQLVSPLGTPQIEALANQVASLGAYAYWNDLVYLELSDYRSVDPLSTTYALQGFAPYWRVAVQNDWDALSAEVGTFGLAGNTYPVAAPPGLTDDNFTDIGLDSQIQYVGDDHLLTLKGSWLQENQNWIASNINSNPQGIASNSTGQLRQLHVDGTYYYRRFIGTTIGYFNGNGNQDATLYAAAPVTGSLNNNPNTAGMIYELNFVPWYNTKFSLQYTSYSEFNGALLNYDGSGRNAFNNNTLLLLGWMAY
jgi:hypothetical protein